MIKPSNASPLEDDEAAGDSEDELVVEFGLELLHAVNNDAISNESRSGFSRENEIVIEYPLLMKTRLQASSETVQLFGGVFGNA